MEEFFYCCQHLPKVDQTYVNQALEGSYKEYTNPTFLWSPSDFIVTRFVSILSRDLGVSQVHYIKNPPYSLYDWHIDQPKRKCSINFPLVVSEHAHTFYRTKGPYAHYRLYEVEYEMFKPTILNIEHEHCVINNCDSDRIVLNISITGATYKETVEYFKNLSIERY